jgi:hypothetical protein
MLLELGPGKVLAGLAGRIRKDFPTLSIGDVPSLKASLASLSENPPPGHF